MSGSRTEDTRRPTDPVGPGLREVSSSLTSLLIVYLIGLSLLLVYLYVLARARDLILSLVEDPIIRNLSLLVLGGVVTLIWLLVWYLSIKKLRDYMRS